MIFGVLFSMFGFLIFLSLLLTNVDKAINSGGIFTGFTLQNSTLPNPVDLLLVCAQQIFPMDYILYTLMVSISSIRPQDMTNDSSHLDKRNRPCHYFY